MMNNSKSILKDAYFFVVVKSEYEVDVFKSTVMLNNDVLIKCEIPSHVLDMVGVIGWVDSDAKQFKASSSGNCL